MYCEHHQHHEDGQDDDGSNIAAEAFVRLVVIELQFTDLASLIIEPSIFVVAIRNVGISAHEIIFLEVTFKKNGEGWRKTKAILIRKLFAYNMIKIPMAAKTHTQGVRVNMRRTMTPAK